MVWQGDISRRGPSNGGGTTVLNADVGTGSAAQDYSANIVRLAKDVTLTGVTISLATVNGTGNGTEFLDINGDAAITGNIGTASGKALESVDISGATSLNGNVTTTGAQTYTGVLTLAGNAVLTGTNPSFNTGAGGVTGAFNLTLNFSGTTAISGTQFTSLKKLETGGGGTTTLTGNVSTTDTQTYNDAVQLIGDTTLTTTVNNVTLASTVDTDATARALTIATGAGVATVTLGGAVGSTSALTTFDSSGTGGSIVLNGGSIKTSGDQSFGSNEKHERHEKETGCRDIPVDPTGESALRPTASDFVDFVG